MELRISAQDVVEEADMGISQVLHGLEKSRSPTRSAPNSVRGTVTPMCIQTSSLPLSSTPGQGGVLE